nr:hypothetical protein [Tanacetum cinerariifolium]
MDLFGPTSVSSISHKWYCLVVNDDFSRFTWTFFLSSKDETCDIPKKFITEIENLKDLKVKIIRRNKTLIEAARTMLADAKLPVTFWAEAVNTAYYVQNKAHDTLLESSSSKPHDESSSQVPKGSGNTNPTISSSNPPADQMETLTVESPIPTVISTACLNDSPEPSSEARLILKRVANQEETPSLDNILLLTNRFENILGVTTSSDETIGVEADVSNMETSISASPTPTLRIH